MEAGIVFGYVKVGLLIVDGKETSVLKGMMIGRFPGLLLPLLQRRHRRQRRRPFPCLLHFHFHSLPRSRSRSRCHHFHCRFHPLKFVMSQLISHISLRIQQQYAVAYHPPYSLGFCCRLLRPWLLGALRLQSRRLAARQHSFRVWISVWAISG